MQKDERRPSAPTACRLLLDPPAAGAWNMAVDEMLLEESAGTGLCFWRFYTWEEPTLSLGYFQSYEDRCSHASSTKCPVVRRASGGGAILHDLELTYSCVWPEGHALAAGRLRLYEAVHASLIAVLAQFGVQASLCGEAAASQNASQPFLCFCRRSPGDVLVGATKIAGSAQRRLRGAVLQHGSILLAQSAKAPELPGLAEVAALRLPANQLRDAWRDDLASRLGVAWHPDVLSNDQRRRATERWEAKYATERWTRSRGR